MIFPQPPRAYDLEDQRQLRTGLDREIQALTPTSGIYTPIIISTGGGEILTYTAQVGQWWRLGSLLWVSADVVLASKSGGSGDTFVSLPTAAGANAILACYVDAMAAGWTGAPMANVDAGPAFAKIRELSAGNAATTWSKLAATSRIRLTGSYLTSE